MNINALLLKDFYKAVHSEMLPPGMVKSVSYWTPRKSRVIQWDHVVNFGLQAFCKEYLIDYFNRNFFERNEDEVVAEYRKYMENTLGVDMCDFNKIRSLHKLGYLPIEIVSLPEGALVPMHCPIFGITNTHPDFAWLGQALESLISAELWYPMTCATVGHTYREIVNKYYDMTCDAGDKRRALGNFDFRGDDCLDAALKAAASWCLSFVNSATVPVVPYLEKYYNCDCENEEVVFGAASTEHFVMCSNSAYDTRMNPDYEYADIDPHRERVFIKRLLTEVYPNKSFSCVCDSYDYWNVVNNILPTLKREILLHNGCFLVRGDSGDCVHIVTQTVFRLWEIFGGTINSKGYKVLDPHVKAIYGDAITVQRAAEIYAKLEEWGFAASNVALGIGSFSMHCIEEGEELKPFTRDTFSFAIKATYAEFNINGEIVPMMIYKDPKTDADTGEGFKKSQKGCCVVRINDEGEYEGFDERDWMQVVTDETNQLKTIFKDSQMVEEVTLSEVRNRLNNNDF